MMALKVRHGLQRLPSPSRHVSLFVHLLGIISFTLSYKYLSDWPSFINKSWGWHYMFLTIIGLTIAHLTFIVGFLADVTLSPRLFSIKNALALCSAPLEVLISILYWGIRLIDQRLIIPPGLYIAPLADYGFHLAPAIFLTVDLLVLSPPWTINALPAMGLSSALAVLYWVWIDECYKHNGFYPYPLFEQLDTPQRLLLFAVAAMMMTGSTLLLKWLYYKLNRSQRHSEITHVTSTKAR